MVIYVRVSGFSNPFLPKQARMPSLLQLKMIHSRHLGGNSFSSKLSATVIVQGQDFATVLHVITPDQRD
jgi:hypothetical protein